MKRGILFFLAFLLALSVSNAWAGQTYWVNKGDTLSRIGQKYKVPWQKIQKANGLKKTKILVGQRLVIPKSGNKKIEKTVSLSGGYTHIYRHLNRNPFRGDSRMTLLRAGYTPTEVREILQNAKNEKGKIIKIEKGDILPWVSFGKNKIWSGGVLVDWDDTEWTYAGKFCASSGKCAIRIVDCLNWAGPPPVKIPPTKPEVPKPPVIKTPPPLVAPPAAPPEAPKLPPIVKAPPEEPTLPPIFKEEKIRLVYEHELDVGAGLWQNQDSSARGAWWFAQYKFFLHNMEKDLAGGTLTPVIGAFARGDLGKNDSGYNWNTWGVGPMVGGMWNGITSKGYPQQAQVMFRALYEHLRGENSSSGYHKDEDHILLGYYAEYLRRFAPDLMTVLYSEGWVDVSRSFTSTWSGDHASNRSGFVIGAKLHKDWSDEWATRLGAQLGYAPQDNTLGANANLEFRYNDWLIFGPSLDYNIISNIAAGGWAYGPFARVELHKYVTETYSVYRSGEVKPADKQLLKY
jgi:hypothetical protein